LAALNTAAARRLTEGQQTLDFDVGDAEIVGGPLEIVSSRMAHLWDGLYAAYSRLGFDRAADGDDVFRDLVLARIIEPTSKADSLRVLAETGVDTVSYRTLTRHLRLFAAPAFTQALSKTCAAQAALGPASLVLYDVSTLYFETDKADGFREPGYSKERRLEPQITIGLLTDATGFPLAVHAFEGDKGETKTMLPVINAFKKAHQLTDVTVVADAGMISEDNQKAIYAAGLTFILGTRIPFLPSVVGEWRAKHPGEEIPDGHIFTQPWPASSSEKARGIPDRVIHYQYRADRARRTLRGIDEQVAKAQAAVDGKAPVKRNRFITVTGESRSVNRELKGQGPRVGRGQGLHAQPDRPECRVRHRRLSPVVAHREGVPDVQARPGRPTDLSPQTRIHRSSPQHRVRRAGRQPLDRTPNRLEHQEIRAHLPPLPHSADPRRKTYPHRRRPATGRPPRRPRPNRRTRPTH